MAVAGAGGDKKGGPFRALLDSGFAVASINYRLSGEAKWLAQLDDCRSALQYLRMHAAEYDIDTKRMGLWGQLSWWPSGFDACLERR